jgi:hypothetical protein
MCEARKLSIACQKLGQFERIVFKTTVVLDENMTGRQRNAINLTSMKMNWGFYA